MKNYLWLFLSAFFLASPVHAQSASQLYYQIPGTPYNSYQPVTSAKPLPVTIAGTSGVIPTANGGTGLSASGANGNCLISNGSIWTSGVCGSGGIAAIVNGGTGSSTASGALQNLGARPNKGGLQLVLNRGWVGNTLRVGTTGARTDIRIDSRKQMTVGSQSVSDFRVVMPSYYLLNSGENVLPNDYTFEAGLEVTSPAMTRAAYFYGQQFINVAQPTPYVISDPIGIGTLAAGATVYLREGQTIYNAAETFLNGAINTATNDTGFISPSTVSQVQATGAMTNPSGGATWTQLSYGFVVGIPTLPMPAVCIVGDSIADGTGDTSTASGNTGIVARGLESVSGFAVPYLRMTASGSTLSAEQARNTGSRMQALWKFCTHIIFEASSNDIAALATLPTLQGYVTTLATAAKSVIGPYGKPPVVIFTKTLPRTTSTDSWATLVNQTPVAGFAIGGVRDTYNTWLDTQVGTLIDAVIDPNQYVESQVTHGVWIVTGAANYCTADGIHPTPACYTLGAQAINTYALTMTAP